MANVTERPRLLFLCQTLPYPPNGGVLIRTYNILRLLARDFEITALCFYRAGSHGTSGDVRAAVDALRRLARVEAFPIPQEHNRPRFVADHVRSILARRPYTIYAYESAEFRGRLREHLRTEGFDMVHLDSLDLAAYFPLLRHLPVVCVHHNVESDLLRRRAQTIGGLSGAYVAFQSSLVEKEERDLCPAIDLNVAVSHPDKATLLSIAPGARFAVVPNGVDTESFRPGDQQEEGIVFVGSHSWHPNRDAMEYFCSCVLPLLRTGGVKDRVTWVGRASPHVILEYAERYDVKLTGFVDDIRPIVQRAACYIAPLRSGGGTRLKILDAWAMGKAVVSTVVGCEGLEARDGENILVRNSPEDFAAAVASVLQDSDLRMRLGNAARKTAVSIYDWELIGDGMLKEYLSVLANRDPSSPERV
ncbi:MAG: glycosyltransferase family 4 protein [Gemmatimonadota bacterium]|nr:glycosyltransferase family 4 protein [Gemmatimonadota bacterium]